MKIILLAILLALLSACHEEPSQEDPPHVEPCQDDTHDGRIGPPLYPPTGAG